MESILKKNRLAIICPVLNCLEYTKGMLESIKSQTPYIIIMIDNGSTDGTEKYLKEKEKNKEIIYIKHIRNEGVAPSWNEGIREAKNKYGCNRYLVVNNDIVLKKCTIDRMMEDIEREDIGMITAYNVNGEIKTPDQLKEYQIPILQKFKEAPDFSCFMIKESTIDKVGYFDENFWPAYFEDNDYHYRMKLQGIKALKDNQIVYFHYGSSTVKENRNIEKTNSEYYLINKEYYIKKWGGEPGNEIYETPFNIWVN
jgi:GT2 family glycosyltransferase